MSGVAAYGVPWGPLSGTDFYGWPRSVINQIINVATICCLKRLTDREMNNADVCLFSLNKPPLSLQRTLYTEPLSLPNSLYFSLHCAQALTPWDPPINRAGKESLSLTAENEDTKVYSRVEG